MAMALFAVERIVFDEATYGGIVSVNYSPGFSEALDSGGSLLDATKQAITDGRPLLTVTTVDVATWLAKLYSGTPTPVAPHAEIASDATLVLYLQNVDGATRGAATSNHTLTIVKGIIVPRMIGLGRAGAAELTLDVYAAYDGTNAPVAHTATANVSLPGTDSPAAAAIHRCHMIKDNTTTISRISTWSIDFGLIVTPHYTRYSYPYAYSITRFAPTATFQTGDLSYLASCGLAGATAGAAGLIFYLAAYNNLGFGYASSGGIALVFGQSDASCFYWPTTIDLGADLVQCGFSVMGLGGPNVEDGDQPLDLLTSQTMPTEAAATLAFKAGPADLSGNTVHPMGGNVDFGLQVSPRTTNSGFWPTVAVVEKRMPTVAITLDDEDILAGAAIGNDGAALTGSGFVQYFRSMAVNGVPNADDAGNHVSITIADGYVRPVTLQGDHNTMTEPGVQVTAVDGGSILAISTSASIS
jgi:hypothetical protein